MEQQEILNIIVRWRGKVMQVEASRNSKIEDLGKKLQKLTNVKADTMKLLLPKSSNKASNLITPFSDKHSHLSLQETSITEGKPIMMMGVFDDEIEEVSKNKMKPDLRIAGFDEEEKQLRRLLRKPRGSLKLPRGDYIFCDFRTLHIPGIELNPPPSEALRRMHMLAIDPGIIGIMTKHRWRVGVMTEMAPEGYVGITPKCLLGFNKNQGEEISLRLRTDDLNGFRKYESIKKTLLHELAHMVHSEHDANFYALDKQLNHEAASLDWTKSKSYTLSGNNFSNHYDEETQFEETNYSGQRLGGTKDLEGNARESSVSAAYRRFLSASTYSLEESQPNPDGGEFNLDDGLDTKSNENFKMNGSSPCSRSSTHNDDESDPDDFRDNNCMLEPDPDDSHDEKPSQVGEAVQSFDKTDPDCHMAGENDILNNFNANKPNAYGDGTTKTVILSSQELATKWIIASVRGEPDPDDQMDELSNQELQRMEEPVAAVCARFDKAIETLRSKVTEPAKAASALHTLLRIVRNVIDHPGEVKFRRIRKANPQFQRSVANCKAAMEILAMVGFCEDVIWDEGGRSETCMVLKREDVALLWLAKSSLEKFIPQ